MKFTKRIYDKIETAILRAAEDGKILFEAATRRGGSGGGYSYRLEQTAKMIREQTMKAYKSAIASASDPENPDFTEWAALMDNLMLDNHLASVIESRILYCQRSPFKFVDDNDTENKEISWLFERPWFDDLIYKVLFSKFQGRTLLELYDLTPDGELEQITEIPQSHFVPQKGVILKSPGGEVLADYRNGPEARFYIQIGRDYDLGELERLAPIVLAKKLGWGALLDYVERFGVPAVFITTDREDDERLKQLAAAASAFKNNNWMVGRGQEKFEIHSADGQGTAPFDTVLNRADEQMSKRVLGGSGISDEKSFVGSAEIQYKLAKDRFESDKLFFKYIFNAKIKPMLVKLSPVYAPLENYYFEWDNSESLTQKEYIEAVAQLAASFEMDIAEIKKTTGLPIIGAKPGGFGGGLPGGEAKGKPFWHG